ncbi:MAG: 50S ribosomal protein L23 [Candidatus Caenarcaniphilales bacterium]|nr:50S ribosomal protein L23 [Candidatus Caenarcaniphilales bacterium]
MSKAASENQNRVILKPVITYKTTQAAQNKCYCFYVSRLSNKYQIAEEFEKLFNAKVLRVNTVADRTKKKRSKKGYSQRADGKKAYIYSDTELDIFPKLEA